MHELSVTRNIVAIVSDRAKGRRVSKVKLQVGKLAGIEVQAVRFCFDLCTEGTPLEGSTLVVDEVDGQATCEACGAEVTIDVPRGVCECEKRGRLRIERGEELLIKEMEVS